MADPDAPLVAVKRRRSDEDDTCSQEPPAKKASARAGDDAARAEPRHEVRALYQHYGTLLKGTEGGAEAFKALLEAGNEGGLRRDTSLPSRLLAGLAGFLVPQTCATCSILPCGLIWKWRSCFWLTAARCAGSHSLQQQPQPPSLSAGPGLSPAAPCCSPARLVTPCRQPCCAAPRCPACTTLPPALPGPRRASSLPLVEDPRRARGRRKCHVPGAPQARLQRH
jgi:hypothetical protein